MNNPIRADELKSGDVVLLPMPYGISKVMNRPLFDPAPNGYIKVILETHNGMITITCARSMCFDHLYCELC